MGEGVLVGFQCLALRRRWSLRLAAAQFNWYPMPRTAGGSRCRLSTRIVRSCRGYLQQIRIAVFPASAGSPEGLRYSLCLVDRDTNGVMVLYDIHRGKGHHRHFRGREAPYRYRGPARLLADFRRDVERIIGGQA